MSLERDSSSGGPATAVTERHVLLVEDNPDDEALARHALKRSDVKCRLTVAHDGEEALDALTGPQPVRPHLVLLDLKMPRVGGLELLRRLLSRDERLLCPVVVFTSSSEPRDIAEAYRLGASSYVVKPVESEVYATVVRRLAEYWLSINLTPESEPLGVARRPVRPPSP